jgi:predicted  nucleic acid-binding Zn-ribbon protein
MSYHNVEQGVRCERLKDAEIDAKLNARSWEDHVRRLNEKIKTENWLLDNLRRQTNRTGDPEGFASDIRRLEDKIRNLERQLTVAENNVREWREKVEELVQEMAQNGCDGFV